MGSDEFIAGIEAQLRWIDEARDTLRAEAKDLVDGYWSYHFKSNEGLKTRDRSTLGVRVRKMKTGDFYIHWYWNQWYKDEKGGWHPLSRYIRKGKGVAYSETTLRRHAKDWELELVMSLERDFAEVRKQARELKLAQMALVRLRALRGGGDQPADTDVDAENEEAVET